MYRISCDWLLLKDRENATSKTSRDKINYISYIITAQSCG
jgi:hypothetical protein